MRLLSSLRVTDILVSNLFDSTASVSKHSKEAQYGSRTKMLSPLFIKTNSVLADSNSPPLPVHCEVS